jgi:hypothetical protein
MTAPSLKPPSTSAQRGVRRADADADGHVPAICSEGESLWRLGLRSNQTLLGAMKLTIALPLATIYVRWLRPLLKTVPLGFSEWGSASPRLRWHRDRQGVVNAWGTPGAARGRPAASICMTPFAGERGYGPGLSASTLVCSALSDARVAMGRGVGSDAFRQS